MKKLKLRFPSFAYEYNPIQYQFVHDLKSHELWMISGVGAGKSDAGVLHDLMVAQLYNSPRDLLCVIVPTYPMYRDIVRTKWLRWYPRRIIKKYHETDHELRLTNGARIIYRSAERLDQIEKIRGMDLRYVRLEEAAGLSKYLYNVAQGRLREGDWTQLAGGTTPKGKNWIYKVIKENTKRILRKTFSGKYGQYTVVKYEGDNFVAYTDIPSIANFHLPEHYIQRLDKKYKGKYRKQELEGKFISMEGLVYDNFDIDKHVIKSIHEIYKEGKHIQMRFIIIDWGFSTPGCVLLVGIDKYDNRIVEDEIYRTRLSPKTIASEIRKRKWLEKYSNIKKILADPSRPDSIHDLREEGIWCDPAPNALITGIERVYNVIENEMLYILEHCQNAINESQLYAWPEKKEGKKIKDEPEDEYNHAWDDIRYLENYLSTKYGEIGVGAVDIKKYEKFK